MVEEYVSSELLRSLIDQGLLVPVEHLCANSSVDQSGAVAVKHVLEDAGHVCWVAEMWLRVS